MVAHKCGSTFTINTAEFIERYEEGNQLKCPNCFEKLDSNILKTLQQFFAHYEILIDKFSTCNFTIREVFDQEIDSEF